MVGLVPLFAVAGDRAGTLDRLPRFRRRMEWYLKYRPTLVGHACLLTRPGATAATGCWRSRTGRSWSGSCPGCSTRSNSSPNTACARCRRGSGRALQLPRRRRWPTSRPSRRRPMYGGNSNWRGPVWFPVNYLMIEALREYHRYFGDSLAVELPRGLGPAGDAGPGRRRDWPTPGPDLPPRRRTGRPARLRRRTTCSGPTRTGATTSPSSSTSTASTGPASAPATRPAGRPWSPSSCGPAGPRVG